MVTTSSGYDLHQPLHFMSIMHNDSLTLVSWPAVIQHREDAELVYIDSLERWSSDTDLCDWRYDEEDRLIDSNGECFSLTFDSEQNRTRVERSEETVTLEEFTRMIQEHLFANAQTCISKVELRNYEDGFRTLAMLAD